MLPPSTRHARRLQLGDGPVSNVGCRRRVLHRCAHAHSQPPVSSKVEALLAAGFASWYRTTAANASTLSPAAWNLSPPFPATPALPISAAPRQNCPLKLRLFARRPRRWHRLHRAALTEERHRRRRGRASSRGRSIPPPTPFATFPASSSPATATTSRRRKSHAATARRPGRRIGRDRRHDPSIPAMTSLLSSVRARSSPRPSA